MNKLIFTMLLVLAVMLGISAQAHATLFLRGQGASVHGTYNLIYDDDFDITWYDYTNAIDTWDNQGSWADSLIVYFGDTPYTDWRLPIALNQDGTGTCAGYNCTGSEMGHLYYTELGNVAYPTTGYGLSNTGYFQNLISSSYWSGTDYPPVPGDAWDFSFHTGAHDPNPKDLKLYALAVRTGDVSAVPEPSTMLLLGSGLFAMGLYRRRLHRGMLA